MKHSESIASIAAALVRAQATMPTIGKDGVNPDFRHKFASLDNMITIVRPILAREGIAIVQGATTPHSDEAGRIAAIAVESMLIHQSGEWISNTAIMPVVGRMLKGGGRADPDPQAGGSALTYGRRYGLAALLCLASDDDDDGNAASRPPKASPRQAKPPAQAKPTPTPSDPADRLVGGKRLGDLTTAKLEEVLAWARDNGKAALETDIETVLETRSDDERTAG